MSEEKSVRKSGEAKFDQRVSLAPLSGGDALRGLLAIPNPDATRPKHAKEPRKSKQGEGE